MDPVTPVGDPSDARQDYGTLDEDANSPLVRTDPTRPLNVSTNAGEEEEHHGPVIYERPKFKCYYILALFACCGCGICNPICGWVALVILGGTSQGCFNKYTIVCKLSSPKSLRICLLYIFQYSHQATTYARRMPFILKNLIIIYTSKPG